MRTVEQSIDIEASPEAVWEVLSDLTAMRAYLHGVKSVDIVSDSSEGVGATRYCVFEDGIELEERVIEWSPGSGYVLETIKAVKVPMESNRIRFEIAGSNGGATVRQSMQYRMKGGLLAPLFERAAEGRMRSALSGALNGLKDHVETN